MIPEKREWRKRLIFDLHDKGYSNKQIADDLRIHPINHGN